MSISGQVPCYFHNYFYVTGNTIIEYNRNICIKFPTTLVFTTKLIWPSSIFNLRHKVTPSSAVLQKTAANRHQGIFCRSTQLNLRIQVLGRNIIKLSSAVRDIMSLSPMI